MDTQDLQKQLEDLKKEVEQLKQRRIFQQDIVPDAIRMRAMGEGNRFVMSGLDADKPEGSTSTDSVTAYFATDTNKWWVFNGTAWKSTTLS